MNTSQAERYDEYEKHIKDATDMNHALKEILDSHDKILAGVKDKNDYILHLQEQIVARDKRIAELEK